MGTPKGLTLKSCSSGPGSAIISRDRFRISHDNYIFKKHFKGTEKTGTFDIKVTKLLF